MKLYATISSERASKGQGGKCLTIEVKDEQRNTIAIMDFENNRAIIRVSEDIEVDYRTSKGKRQKGEISDDGKWECKHHKDGGTTIELIK